MLLMTKKKIRKLTEEAGRYIDEQFVDYSKIRYSLKSPNRLPKSEPKYSRQLKPQQTPGDEPERKGKFSQEPTFTRYSEEIEETDAILQEWNFEAPKEAEEVENYFEAKKEPTFTEEVIRIIRERGYRDPEVYRRAHLDRRIFSKIISNHQYTPSKDTAVMICFGLKLSLDEAEDLLKKAGFSLSHSNKRDLAIEYFIMKGILNVGKLNRVLENMDLKPLGREQKE